MASISELKVHKYFFLVRYVSIVAVIGRKSLWSEQEWMIKRKKLYSLCYQFSLISFGLCPIADCRILRLFPSIEVRTWPIRQYAAVDFKLSIFCFRIEIESRVVVLMAKNEFIKINKSNPNKKKIARFHKNQLDASRMEAKEIEYAE